MQLSGPESRQALGKVNRSIWSQLKVSLCSIAPGSGLLKLTKSWSKQEILVPQMPVVLPIQSALGCQVKWKHDLVHEVEDSVNSTKLPELPLF